VIKNLYQFKESGLQRILTKFSMTNCKREGLVLKRFEKCDAPTNEATDRNMCITEENGTTVDELLDIVSQEDQKQTYLLAHQIP